MPFDTYESTTMLIIILIATTIAVIVFWIKCIQLKLYTKLETEVLKKLQFSDWDVVSYFDEDIIVKSRSALDKYDEIKFFKEHSEKLEQARLILEEKGEIAKTLREFLKNNEYKQRSQYEKLAYDIKMIIKSADAYRIKVTYISTAGNDLGSKEIELCLSDISRLEENPYLLMNKSEYNQYLKDQQKESLMQKQHQYYNSINNIIDFANKKRELLFINGSVEQLDDLIEQLLDRAVANIKRIKTVDTEEWDIVEKVIRQIGNEINKIVVKNKKILDYYNSDEFLKVKKACETLMNSQREFNEYITEKVNAISHLFGTKVIRNETINEDEYKYVRPYKKTISPFTAEVSATIFASAENHPLDYVIKNFYSNKELYPEQIQKLHQLIGELETLKDAKQIIDNYKIEYQKYLGNVPEYVMINDEEGFYSRLGFARIDENVLNVEYKFSYTSGGGMAKRTFSVPMTEETIVDLIKALEGKLSAHSFSKEQRALMTSKLREYIKKRDNYTCCNCGNSIYAEPNLLLEIEFCLMRYFISTDRYQKEVVQQKIIFRHYVGNVIGQKVPKLYISMTTPDAAHRGFVLFQYNINFMRLAVVGAFDFSIERHAVKCHLCTVGGSCKAARLLYMNME